MTMATTRTNKQKQNVRFKNNTLGNKPLAEVDGIDRKHKPTPVDKDFSDVDRATKKARLFMDEPMGNKPLTAVGGIGPDAARRLTNHDFNNAAQLYVHFLDKGRKKEEFTNWFSQVTKANTRHQLSCYDSLNGYYQNYHCDN